MILPDFNRDEILTKLANRYAAIDIGIGTVEDWKNLDMKPYYDKVFNDYNYVQRKIDAGFQLNSEEQEFVNDIKVQQRLNYGNDVGGGGYDKRMTFPDIQEFNKFLEAKGDYINLMESGIYEYIINEFGEVEFYNAKNSS